MTGFDFAAALRGSNRSYLEGGATPRSTYQPDQAWWQDIIEFVGQTEHAKAKGLGLLLDEARGTYTPKYQEGGVFSDGLDDQILYMDVLHDAGVPKPLAFAVGLGLSVVDPTEWLNKLSVFKLTKSGRVGEALSKGAKLEDNLVSIGKTAAGKSKFAIKTGDVAEQIADYTRQIKSLEKQVAEKSGGLGARQNTKDLIKNNKRQLAKAREELKYRNDLNQLLDKYQEAGMSIDELKLAGTKAEQLRKGQRTLVGLNPFTSTEHIPFVGGRDRLKNVSVGGNPVSNSLNNYPRALSGILADAAGEVTTKLKGVREDFAQKTGGRFIRTENQRKASVDMLALIRENAGRAQLDEQKLKNIINKYKLDPAQVDEIFSKLDVPVEQTRHILKRVNDLWNNDPEIFSIGKGIQRTSEDELIDKLDRHQRLSDQQKLILTPSGLTPKDFPKVLDQYGNGVKWTPRNTAFGKATVTDDFVVIEDFADQYADFNALNDFYGVNAYARTSDGSKDYLLAKRLPGARFVTDSNQVTNDHIDNIEALFANLAKRKKAVVGLGIDDILISDTGAVQLINPSLIKPVKDVNAALNHMGAVLNDFITQTGVLHVRDQNGFYFLRNKTNARKAPKVYGARVLKSLEADTPIIHVDDLLSEAVNLQVERSFLKALSRGENLEGILQGMTPAEFRRANNIDTLVTRYREELARTGTVAIEPIKVTKAADNSLIVAEGADRLLAAKLIGSDAVPIRVREGFKETIDKAAGYVTKTRLPLREAWENDQTFRPNEIGKQTGQQIGSDVFSGDYRLRGDQVSDLDLRKANDTRNQLTETIRKIFQVGLPPGQGKIVHSQRQLDKLAEFFGSNAVAAATLADSIYTSEKFDDVVSLFTNLGADTRWLQRARIPDGSKAQLHELLKGQAESHLAELASNKLLTQSSAKIPEFRYLAASATNGTFAYIDEASNSLEFYSKYKDLDGLQDQAKQFLRQFGGSDGMDPFADIKLISMQTGETSVYQIKELIPPSDLVRLADLVVTNAGFEVSEQELKRWRAEGILLNPSSNDLGLRQGFSLGAKDNFMPFMVTRSGDFIVSTKHTSVKGMSDVIFEDGPVLAQETGLILPGKVIIEDLASSNIEILNNVTGRAMSARIKVLAKSLRKMGLNDTHKLDIGTRFDPEVWHRVYQTKSIGEILDSKWKLKIPNELKDTLVNVRDILTKNVIGYKQVRFSDANVEKVYNYIKENLDEKFLAEFERGLVQSYTYPYYPRSRTQAAIKAMAEYTQRVQKADPKRWAALEPFQKRRTIQDITTRDFNKIFKTLQKLAKGKEINDGTVQHLTNEAYKAIRKDVADVTDIIDNEKMRAYLEIASLMPSGSDFFEVDARMAYKLRRDQHTRALTKDDLVTSLKDQFGVFTGKVDDVIDLSKTNKKKQKLLDQIGDRTNKAAKLDEEVESLINSGSTDKERINNLREESHKLIREAKDLQIEADNITTASLDKHGVAGYHAGMKAMYITGDNLRELIESGKVSADHLRDVNQAIVRINTDQIFNAARADGLEVIAFADEMVPVVDRYFGATTRDGLAKILKVTDAITNFFKLNTLFPLPQYFFRNTLSDAFLLWLGGVSNADSYATPMTIMKIGRNLSAGKVSIEEAEEALRAISIYTADGKSVNGLDFYNAFFERGGVTGGTFYNEFNSFGNANAKSDIRRMLEKQGMTKSSFGMSALFTDHIGIRVGMKANTTRETYFRMAAFYDEFARTGDYALAEQNMKKLLYDYNDLNAFERDVFRRVYPFYTWARKNIPRQVATMVTRPEVHLKFAKFAQGTESLILGDNKPGPYDIASWARQNGLIIGKGDDGKYAVWMIDNVVPLFDAYKLVAGLGFAESISNGISPLFKLPIEAISNTSWFTGAPIEGFPGQRSDKYGFLGFSERVSTKGPLGLLNVILNEQLVTTFGRPIDEVRSVLSNFFDPAKNIKGISPHGLAAIDIALGSAVIQDPERVMAGIQAERRQLMSAYNRAIRRFEELGNYSYANEVRGRMYWVDAMSAGFSESSKSKSANQTLSNLLR